MDNDAHIPFRGDMLAEPDRSAASSHAHNRPDTGHRAPFERRDRSRTAPPGHGGWPHRHYRASPAGIAQTPGPDHHKTRTSLVKAGNRVSPPHMNDQRRARQKIPGTRQRPTLCATALDHPNALTITAVDWTRPKHIPHGDHIARTTPAHVAQPKARPAQPDAPLAKYQNSERPT